MIFLALLIGLVGLRTIAWHLQCWQIREYRLDRMKAWIRTKDGQAYWHPWWSKGLLPRPKLSARIVLIIGILGILGITLLFTNFYFLTSSYFLPLAVLIWERTLWLQVGISVLLSGIPARWKKKQLFAKARRIVVPNPDIIRIGITGSYGKSSTKELLVHLLKAHFGKDQVLYNPANQNHEVAIARLMIENQNFFDLNNKKPRVLVVETGAYKRGEIATVCQMIKPQIGILTGLSNQHLDLFGSIENIAKAKFELPHACQDIIFFNANNERLTQLIAREPLSATKIGIGTNAAQDIKTDLNQSTFSMYGKAFTLPWPGGFFVENALLALECAREIGVPTDTLVQALKNLEPLERALSAEVQPTGYTLLRDTYSANLDGVLRAVEHLGKFKGRKVFIGIPLRELGHTEVEAHQAVFQALKDINASVFWAKPDFAELGKKLLGDDFHLIENAGDSLKELVASLGENDALLLESKIPSTVLKPLGL